MKNFLLAAFLVAIGWGAAAQQWRVSGTVLDAKTKEPLPYASVFVDQTTAGSNTNDDGEFVIDNVPVGTRELTVSFVGYTTQHIAISPTSLQNVTVLLRPDERMLAEVVVKSKRDKPWQKQLKRFTKSFIGEVPDCKIVNPWGLEFTEAGTTLIANSTQTLEIENRWLGYKIRYELKSFRATELDFAMNGVSHFYELDAQTTLDAAQWSAHRKSAYAGSVRDLMKSIIDRRIQGRGFSLYRQIQKGKVPFDNFTKELQANLEPYDSASLSVREEADGTYTIAVKEKMQVICKNKIVDKSFYDDISYPVSWIEVPGGQLKVNRDGVVLNSSQLVLTGDMAEQRLGSMLPLNYKPGEMKRVKEPAKLSARRLQESPYLHTDRTCYYSGDTIWFSAYIKYRAPSLRDTLSRVLYVELISSQSEVIRQLMLPIERGRTRGAFALPFHAVPGNYTIRAYTQWMRNYGVSQFFYKPLLVLLDQETVAEIEHPVVPDHNLKVKFDRSSYSKRKLVTMSLLPDTAAEHAWKSGSFSVSVVDENLGGPAWPNQQIETGYSIAEPTNDMLPRFTFPIEHNITFRGKFTAQYGSSKGTKITIVPQGFDQLQMITTQDNGEFTADGFVFYDTIKLGYLPREGKIKTLPMSLPGLPITIPKLNLKVVSAKDAVVHRNRDSLESKMLSEVKVTASRMKPKRPYQNSYGMPDHLVKGEQIETYQNLAAAIAARVPMLRLLNDAAHWYLNSIRGNLTSLNGRAEPMLFVENVQVIGETTGDRLVAINPYTVDHIEVMEFAPQLGAQGAFGAIYVYLKNGGTTGDPLPTFSVKGYDRSPTFKSPNLASIRPEEDLRSTLYWNDRVEIRSGKETKLSFFTSDHAGVYRVIIEGVTREGVPIHHEELIRVEN